MNNRKKRYAQSEKLIRNHIERFPNRTVANSCKISG